MQPEQGVRRRIIPVGRNAVVHWLKLPVRPHHRKIQEKTKVR